MLPTVKDYVAKNGKAPAGLSFPLAALLNFYHGRFNAAGEYEGVRQGKQTYSIRDGAELLKLFDSAWQASDDVKVQVKTLVLPTRGQGAKT